MLRTEGYISTPPVTYGLRPTFPPVALTGRSQPSGKAGVAGAAHTVPLATQHQGHTHRREKLSVRNPGNPQTATETKKHTLYTVVGL